MQIRFKLQCSLIALANIFLSNSVRADSGAVHPMEIVAESTPLQGPDLEHSEKQGPAVIQFWASWCHRCSTMFSELATLASNYPDIKIMAISIDENKGEAQAYLQKHAAMASNWTNVSFRWDHQGQLKEKMDVQSVPTVLLLNKNGRILTRSNGHLKKSDLFLLTKELGQTANKGVTQ